MGLKKLDIVQCTRCKKATQPYFVKGNDRIICNDCIAIELKRWFNNWGYTVYNIHLIIENRKIMGGYHHLCMGMDIKCWHKLLTREDEGAIKQVQRGINQQRENLKQKYCEL
jgi:hypothetical protein